MQLCLLFSICLKAQIYQNIPWYPNDDRIKQEMEKLFKCDTLVYIVYQPDRESYYHRIQSASLWTDDDDRNTYSFVFVEDKVPNIIIFSGDTIIEKYYNKDAIVIIKELLQMKSVWVDKSEAQMKVVVPWMFPEGCENVFLNNNNMHGCFQLPSNNSTNGASVIFNLNPEKNVSRENFIEKMRQIISLYKIDINNHKKSAGTR